MLHKLSVSYPTFPDLSRKPALRTKSATVDPTLRDSMDNGMQTTRAKFTRRRRVWSVAIDFLTNVDHDTLEQFVEEDAVYGANIFYFPDLRDPTKPKQHMVRFSVIPVYTDAGWIESEFRQNCTFELSEV